MRSPRRKIDTGGLVNGLEVNAAGVIYLNDRILPVVYSEIGCRKRDSRNPSDCYIVRGLPAVDVGAAYNGPVPPILGEGTRFCLVEELVCYHFHGAPPGGWKWSYVEHIDGDRENNAAGNLAWATYEKEKSFAQAAALIKPDVVTGLGARRMGFYQHYAYKPGGASPVFTESASVPGHIPTSPEQIGAA